MKHYKYSKKNYYNQQQIKKENINYRPEESTIRCNNILLTFKQ